MDRSKMRPLAMRTITAATLLSLATICLIVADKPAARLYRDSLGVFALSGFLAAILVHLFRAGIVLGTIIILLSAASQLLAPHSAGSLPLRFLLGCFSGSCLLLATALWVVRKLKAFRLSRKAPLPTAWLKKYHISLGLLWLPAALGHTGYPCDCSPVGFGLLSVGLLLILTGVIANLQKVRAAASQVKKDMEQVPKAKKYIDGAVDRMNQTEEGLKKARQQIQSLGGTVLPDKIGNLYKGEPVSKAPALTGPNSHAVEGAAAIIAWQEDLLTLHKILVLWGLVLLASHVFAKLML